MNTPLSFSEMRSVFLKFGSLAIEDSAGWKRASAKPDYLHFGAARIDYNLLGLVAAHFEGLGSIQMAQIVKNCGITINDFIDGVDFDMGGELEWEGDKADLVEFLRKSLDAILIAGNHWSQDSALPEDFVTRIRESLDQSGRFALAVTLLGKKALSYGAYQQDLLTRLASEEVGQEGAVLDSSLMTAFSAYQMVDAWNVDGPYNNGQLADFLTGSGALESLSINNATGLSAFWTNVVYGLSENELCQPLLELVFRTHPHLALPIVRSIDMEMALKLEGTLGMRDLNTLANSLDCLISCLQKEGLSNVLKPVDVMVNFARAGVNLHEFDDPDENDFIKIMAGFRKAGTPEKVFEHIYKGNVEIKGKISSLGLKIDLTAELMAAQLKTPLPEVPLSHFMQWGFMASYGLIPGACKPSVVTKHLIHMAKAACSFKLPGHEKLLDLRNTYEGVDKSMRDLVGAVGASLDIKALLNEPAQVRDMLSIWGIDPRVLNISCGKAIDRWMAGDLGL